MLKDIVSDSWYHLSVYDNKPIKHKAASPRVSVYIVS